MDPLLPDFNTHNSIRVNIVRHTAYENVQGIVAGMYKSTKRRYDCLLLWLCSGSVSRMKLVHDMFGLTACV